MVGGEIFHTCPDRPWGPAIFLHVGYRVFPGGKERPGRDADPTPPSSAVVMKGQSYTSTPPMGRTACTEPRCLYKGALYLTSVPVQGCTLPFFSACTRVTFTFTLPFIMFSCSNVCDFVSWVITGTLVVSIWWA